LGGLWGYSIPSPNARKHKPAVATPEVPPSLGTILTLSVGTVALFFLQ